MSIEPSQSSGEHMPFHSGAVSLVGRPNVGKSTLLNQLVGEKVAIVSRVPQTTRNQIRGIYTDERCQIVFIDTPGLHTGRDRLDDFMNQSAYTTTGDVDALVHVVDVSEPTGPDEERIVKRLAGIKIPVVLALNKIDRSDKFIPEYIQLWEQIKGKPAQELTGELTLLPLSGAKGVNTDKLIEVLYDVLPEGPPLYPEDVVTDLPQTMAIADIIREKLLNILRDEVPHAVAVIIERMEPRRGKTLHISALILVERDTQKSIVIGKGGQTLKTVGTQAREELTELLETKVYLDLHVKSTRNWRDSVDLLQQMGYDTV